MANLYNVPLENSVQLVLQNALLTGETTTITFTSSVTSKLQASSTMKGVLVIDRVDANGTETPTKTEYIAFTGVTGSTVTGLTRGLANTTDQDHAAGAIVELVPDVTWAQAINDVLTTQHNDDGTHKTLSLLSLVSVTLNNSIINNAVITNTSFSGNSLVSVNIGSSAFDNGYITGASLVSTTFVNRTFIPVAYRTINTSAATALDLSTANIFSLTLSTATTTLAFSNPVAGQAVILRLGQDSTGGRRVVFPSTTLWSGGTAPILTSTASKNDVFGFLCTASGYYDGYIVGLNL
jgi:uncharacterized protein YjbI with pentapeptide repeats